MHITPLDIRKQEFSRRMRGDDPDEVRAFLKVVADQWEAMMDEQRRLENRLRDQERKLQHYEHVEEALQEALKTARQSARQTQDMAERKGAQIIKEAENQAEEIKRTAEQDRLRLRRETSKLDSRRNEIVARLRAFLMSELELLAHFEGSDPIGFIKLLPSEGRVGADFRLPSAKTAETEGDASRTSGTKAKEDAKPRRQSASNEEREEEEVASIGTQRVATAPVGEGPEENEDHAPSSAPSTASSDEAGGEPTDASTPDRSPPTAAERTSERQDDALPASETVRSGPGWVNRPIISSPPTYGGFKPNRDASSKEKTAEDPARSGEEIEKIRRILRELD